MVGVGRPPESIEGVGELVVRETRAAVQDVHPRRPTRRGVDDDLDRARRWGHGDGVVEIVVEDLVERTRHGQRRRLAPVDDLDADLLFLGERCPHRRPFGHDGRHVDRRTLGRHRGVGTGEREQTVDEALQAVDLAVGVTEDLRRLGRVVVDQRGGPLELQAQRRQRRAQLVRRVAGEAPLLVDESGETAGHRVERRRQGAQLWRSLRVVGAFVEVTAGDALGAVAQLAQRPGDRARHEQGGDGGGEQGDPGDDDQPSRPATGAGIDLRVVGGHHHRSNGGGTNLHRDGDRDDVAVAAGRRTAAESRRHLGARRQVVADLDTWHPGRGDHRAAGVGDHDARALSLRIADDGVGQGDLGIGVLGVGTGRRRQRRSRLAGEQEGVALELGELAVDLDAAQVRHER